MYILKNKQIISKQQQTGGMIMAKKGSLLKTVIGIGSLAVAGKVAYDKYRNTKEKYVKEEKESADDVVKKYNAIAESKVIEIQDEEFEGCEIKASASKVVLDLSLAVIEKDVYINFKSQASSVVIVVPEGVNVTCDIEKVASRVRNEVINVDEEGIHTVYVIGNASVSNVDIIPVDFYGEDEDFEDEDVEAEADESNTDDAADAGESGENTVEAKPEVKADVDEKAEKSDGDRDDTDETDEIPLQEV
ncbi:hypothetical protein BACPEC_01070 [[Bacteroides] pectinophilus ATCC 43243]|uniref:Uncharacterized protein n=1 Tax=[Bacteroides] pectinophilus ATCC 43243 TaxID=483218 RepID=B7AQW3_9FIRM|nr:hypothetical protein BACPEC_01070 [[Bacteroides] pectinophilus ATCC 43243]